MSQIISHKLYRRGFPHGLMFHRFRKNQESNSWQGALSPEEFEKILLYVGIDNIVSPQDWMSRLKNNSLDKQDLCITFDDGLRCQMDIALPVLEKYNLQAFWFVYSSVFEGTPAKSEVYSYVASKTGGMELLIEKFLLVCPDTLLTLLNSIEFSTYTEQLKKERPFYSLNDIKYRFLRNNFATKKTFEETMDRVIADIGFQIDDILQVIWMTDMDLKKLVQNKHYIGLHSHDHPYKMAELSYKEQLRQYKKNYAYIQKITNNKIECASYPLNSYNKDTMDILRKLEIHCAFRSDTFPSAYGDINSNHLELAREDSANLLAVKNLIK